MRIAAILLLLMLAFAGCTDNNDPTPSEDNGSSGEPAGGQDTQGETGDSTPADGNETSDGNATDNAPPEINVNVGEYTGTIPFDVTFTINATDADNDTLSWNLTRGTTEEARGTEFPGNVTLSFTEPGAHNISVAVHDGTDTSYANFTIDAAIGEPAGPQVVEVITASWRTGAGTTAALGAYLFCSGPEDGNTIAIRGLDPAHKGRTFTASITDDSGGVAIESWRLIFNSPDCGTDTYPVGTGDGGGAAELEGSIPDLYDLVFFTSTGGANLDSTLTIYA